MYLFLKVKRHTHNLGFINKTEYYRILKAILLSMVSSPRTWRVRLLSVWRCPESPLLSPVPGLCKGTEGPIGPVPGPQPLLPRLLPAMEGELPDLPARCPWCWWPTSPKENNGGRSVSVNLLLISSGTNGHALTPITEPSRGGQAADKGYWPGLTGCVWIEYGRRPVSGFPSLQLDSLQWCQPNFHLGFALLLPRVLPATLAIRHPCFWLVERLLML